MNNKNTEPSLTEILTSTEPREGSLTDQEITGIPCPKCGKVFSNIVGVRMHDMRVHTKVLIARGAKGFKPKASTPNREKELAQRRKYQQKLRARYYREGKNSKGQKMPPGWKPMPRIAVLGIPKRNKSLFLSDSSAYKRRKYREMRERNYAKGLTATGKPFTTPWGKQQSLAIRQGKRPHTGGVPVGAKLAKWTPERHRKFRETMKKKYATNHGMEEAPAKPTNKRIQFVYPTPEEHPDKGFERHPEITVKTTAIRFCPHCGTNIEKHL